MVSWPAARAARAPEPRASRSLPMPSPRRPETPARVTYSIGELAREFALTTRAIRFYEDCGLVRPERAGRARIYGERERVRIKLILRGKRLGLSLSEIGELLDLYEVARNERAQLAKFLALLDERRGRLLQQKEDIDAVLVEIDGIERECRRRLRDEAPREAAGRSRTRAGSSPKAGASASPKAVKAGS